MPTVCWPFISYQVQFTVDKPSITFEGFAVYNCIILQIILLLLSG